MSDLYDIDVVAWSEQQSELLRRRAAGDFANEAAIDWANVAEEIESLGQNDKRELRNRVATILFHLIKIAASPATNPGAGWRDTVLEQRSSLRDLLDDSPSLKPRVAEAIAGKIDDARARARVSLQERGETAIVDIDGLTFTEDQVLGDWFPD